MTEQIAVGKIRLKCRRGMLELDVMLQRFVAKKLEQLTQAQLKILDKLLDQPDPVLLTWLLGQHIPEDKNDQSMVELIRSC